jgi:cob(I)alamin adenosyltransferase
MTASHVTTKQGDDGRTRALSGDTLDKDHPVIECSGWVDATRAQLALLYTLIEADAAWRDNQELRDDLLWLIHCCFIIGAAVNDPEAKHPEFRFGNIGTKQLQRLEEAQAHLEASLAMPHAFIAAASNPLAAQADVVATTARTLERRVIALAHACPAFDIAGLLPFLNRLGDYCYIVARYLDGGTHRVVDYERFL